MMKQLLFSLFVFPAVLLGSRAQAQEATFDWDAFSREVDRFIGQASEDGFAGWEGDLLNAGLFETYGCTETFMGGSGVLYKDLMGGYEFVIVFQVDEPSTLETPSELLQQNYRYFTEWLGLQNLVITTTQNEGYAGLSKIREGVSVDLEPITGRKQSTLGFAIAYETVYTSGSDQFQYGLVLTISGGITAEQQQEFEHLFDGIDWGTEEEEGAEGEEDEDTGE